MHYTEIQISEIQRAFLRRRRNQLVLAAVLVPVMVGVVVGAVLCERHLVSTILGVPPEVAANIFLVLVVGGLLFSFWNWRCPACSKYLGRASARPKINLSRCPNCGVRFRS